MRERVGQVHQYSKVLMELSHRRKLYTTPIVCIHMRECVMTLKCNSSQTPPLKTVPMQIRFPRMRVLQLQQQLGMWLFVTVALLPGSSLLHWLTVLARPHHYGVSTAPATQELILRSEPPTSLATKRLNKKHPVGVFFV